MSTLLVRTTTQAAASALKTLLRTVQVSTLKAEVSTRRNGLTKPSLSGSFLVLPFLLISARETQTLQTGAYPSPCFKVVTLMTTSATNLSSLIPLSAVTGRGTPSAAALAQVRPLHATLSFRTTLALSPRLTGMSQA
jgi:hypothetical protein